MKQLTTILSIALLISSCVPLHRSSSHFTPTFEQANSIDAEASFDTEGFNGTLGYSATENIGLFVGGNYTNFDLSNDTSLGRAHITRYIYGGVGYFGAIHTVLTKKQSINTDYMSFYVGAGTGYYRARGEKYRSIFGRGDDAKVKVHQRGWFNTYFAQIGWNEKVEYINERPSYWTFFSTKFQFIDFIDYDNFTKYYKTSRPDTDAWFVETVIGQEHDLIRDRLRVTYQFGLTAKIGDKRINYDYRTINMQAGISYNLPVKKQ